MLSNDLSKRLAIRFKKSKDFEKTIEKLKKEGFEIERDYDAKSQHKILRVYQDKKRLINIVYYDRKPTYLDIDFIKDNYKEYIFCIVY